MKLTHCSSKNSTKGSAKASWWLCAALPLGLVLNSSAPAFAAETAAPAAPVATTPAATAPAAETPADNAPLEFPKGMLFPHYLLDRVLSEKVDANGNVNYAAIQNDKQGKLALNYFLQAIAGANLSDFPVLPTKTIVKDKLGRETEVTTEDRAPELVFWINAYNAHVVNAILEVYPLNPADNVKEFDTAKTRRVAGKNYSFAEMRKKIIGFDPRAFFALSDGTQGGPYLRPTAYRYTNIGETLDEAVQIYISNPRQVQLLMLEKKVTLNPILQEIDEYFSPKGARRKWEGIRTLLTNYSIIGSSQRFYANNPDVTLVFTVPNRSLNRQSSGPVAAP